MAGRLAQLSLRAIRTVAALPTADAAVIARRLYTYGATPFGREAELAFGPGDNALNVLGLAPGGAVRGRLAQDYEATTHPGWISFTRLGRTAGEAPDCKLYVSPRPEALADAFPILAQTFADLNVASFKVGRGAAGLLRPDKIVAYFYDTEHLGQVAGALSRALGGLSPQGAPFTAEIAGDGLLSWGRDPPPVAGAQPESWRAWITARLAEAVVAVRRPGLDPVPDVMARMTALGVQDWTPTGRTA
jgi:hypothetical protein